MTPRIGLASAARRAWLARAGLAGLGAVAPGLGGCQRSGGLDGHGAAFAAAAPGAAAPEAHDAPDAPRLKLVGHVNLPMGTDFKGTLVGGLSGLSWDAASGLWYAISDDRSRHAPARCYVFRLPPLGGGQAPVPQWVDVITLRGADGQPFARYSVDPEAVVLRPGRDGGANTLLWTSEGDVRAGVPPAVYESALDGRLLRTLTLPPELLQLGRPGRGPVNNETLEGLALTPDGRHVWAAMESALAQEQPPALPTARPGPARFTRIDLASGRADRQIAYELEPRPFGPLVPQGPFESGASEVLMRDERRMWVLERAFTLATGVSARLYEADLSAASDTLAADVLRPGAYRPAGKRLLLDLSQSGLPHVDNFEAMAWGPRLTSGRPSLVLLTDDNFNPLQVTEIAVFEVFGLAGA